MGRKLLWLLLLLAIAAGAGFWFGREPFRQWQQRRLHAASDAFLKQGDLRSSFLSARQALQNDPRDLRACARLAQIADLTNSPEAVLWRQRLVEIKPGAPRLLLDLAATSVRLGETFIAEQALARVEGKARESFAFHEASAALAITTKQFGLAEQHFQKILELAPKNDSVRLNLATLRLGRSADAGEARAMLEELRTKPEFRLAATRALLADARRRGEAVLAMKLATDLGKDAGATLEDRLLYVEELQQAKSPEFENELPVLQKLAAGNAGFVYILITWMNGHGLASRSLEWSDTLSPAVRAQMPVPLGMAEACANVGDWRRVRELVAAADWGELEFVRLAIDARVSAEMSGHKRDESFQSRWERALHSTRSDPNALAMLARLVRGWGWKAEEAEAWWRIAAGPAGQRPALKALFRLHSADKNTRELYRVARRIFQLEPANPGAKNNVAMLALLLGEDLPEAQKLAEENFRLAPKDPTFASTQALSFHRQQRAREGVQLLASLPDTAWKDPSLAACYGVLLAADGQHDKARPYLDTAAQHRQELFPEEAALVDAALKPQ